jgi:RecA-family ATPase
MHIEMVFPTYTKIGGTDFQTGEIECRVEIEPDESFACASWYVSGIYVEAFVRRKWQKVEVQKDDPLFETLKAWALQEYDAQLEALWDEYLEDKPKRRPNTDREEHSTQWGRP